ncbi:hypothetical protein CRG98_019287 [Punica granatum]|uniref:Uncharacterized protein n=1 Tax=Punica granatum TaxID=22663 RepID=A0A2I0JVM8_PUNGR|nr:hypothetical protein CRG98_019287 [Punica granatum]
MHKVITNNTTYCLICSLDLDNFGPTFKVLAHVNLRHILFPSSVISIIATIITPSPSLLQPPSLIHSSSTSIVTSTIVLCLLSSSTLVLFLLFPSTLVLLLHIGSSSISSAILSFSIILLIHYTLLLPLSTFIRLVVAAACAYHRD